MQVLQRVLRLITCISLLGLLHKSVVRQNVFECQAIFQPNEGTMTPRKKVSSPSIKLARFSTLNYL